MSLISEYVHAIDLDVHEILRSDMKLMPSLTERLTDFAKALLKQTEGQAYDWIDEEVEDGQWIKDLIAPAFELREEG